LKIGKDHQERKRKRNKEGLWEEESRFRKGGQDITAYSENPAEARRSQSRGKITRIIGKRRSAGTERVRIKVQILKRLVCWKRRSLRLESNEAKGGRTKRGGSRKKTVPRHVLPEGKSRGIAAKAYSVERNRDNRAL